MKVISLWQPWASLLIHNHKFIETRSWPAPKSLLGQRIGIASTKQIKPEQIAAYNDPEFQQFYSETGLPELMELPRGCLLGTVLMHSCEPMTDETIEEITEVETAFGHYAVGRYCWRMRNPTVYDPPLPVRGAQGIWEWDPHDVLRNRLEADAHTDQERAAQAWRDHPVPNRAVMFPDRAQGRRYTPRRSKDDRGSDQG